MDIVDLPQYHLTYAQLPYSRNQDIVKIISGQNNGDCIVCVADGWNDLDLNDNEVGRNVATTVAQLYPKYFLESPDISIDKRVKYAAEKTETIILEKFPVCATSVAMFLFPIVDQDIIVSVGDEEIYLWNGDQWNKPKEIDNHPIPENPRGSFRFFGCPSKKKDSRFSPLPDVLSFFSDEPCIIATDGIKDVLSVEEINYVMKTIQKRTSKAIVGALVDEIQQRGTQTDDISILVRW